MICNPKHNPSLLNIMMEWFSLLILHHVFCMNKYADNPLTPELNPSAQRCLTRFVTVYFALEPCISLIYAWKTNKYTNYSFSLLLCMVFPSCFGITLPSSGSVLIAFWEMLNWGAVDRIVWMDVVGLVTWGGGGSDRAPPLATKVAR
jgi:hypothetical protein